MRPHLRSLFFGFVVLALTGCTGGSLEPTPRPTTEAYAYSLTQEALPRHLRDAQFEAASTLEAEEGLTVAEYMEVQAPTPTYIPLPTEENLLPPLLPYPNQPMSDGLLLARLGVAECRGMGPRRDQCHFSVMSTVMTRIKYRFVSDGTVYGTLDWGVDGTQPQFVPWVTRGCNGISAAACNDNEPIQWAVDNAYAFLAGQTMPGTCNGYVYYNSIPGGENECLLTGSGQFVEFFQQYDDSVPGPRTVPPTFTPAPTPTATPRVGAQFTEGILLTDLGIAQCREFRGDIRDLCHLSLISLVYARIAAEYKSDGTLYGTLAHNIGIGTPAFDPWITYSCDPVYTETCLDNVDTEWALENAYAYLSNQPLDGACTDFLEYTRVPDQNNSCILQQGGLYIGFHTPLESQVD